MDKTLKDIVLEYFPGVTDDAAEFILWEKTGYPCFWGTANVGACLRKQLQEFKDSIRQEIGR